jgi:hypothetical protein
MARRQLADDPSEPGAARSPFRSLPFNPWWNQMSRIWFVVYRNRGGLYAD